MAIVVMVVGAMTLAVGPTATAQAQELDIRDGFENGLDPAWTFRDGYAIQLPDDPENHASVDVIFGHLSLSFPRGAEHNQWVQRQAEVQRDYPGSGVYQIKVDSDFTRNQQVGLSFESAPGTFMHFMLYSDEQVFAFVERFSNVDGVQHQATVGEAGTGLSVPAKAPWYLRVTVNDDPSSQRRTWHFEWSNNGVNWATVVNGVIEDAAPSANVGTIRKVGIFTGNHPDRFSAYDGRIDYFTATSRPLPPSPLAEAFVGRVAGPPPPDGAPGATVGAGTTVPGALTPVLVADGLAGEPDGVAGAVGDAGAWLLLAIGVVLALSYPVRRLLDASGRGG